MARRQVLLVGQDAGIEADYDADVLAQVLVTLGGKLWSTTKKTMDIILIKTFDDELMDVFTHRVTSMEASQKQG